MSVDVAFAYAFISVSLSLVLFMYLSRALAWSCYLPMTLPLAFPLFPNRSLQMLLSLHAYMCACLMSAL